MCIRDRAFNPALGIGTIIRSFDVAKDGLAPYSESWNIVLQRQLPWNLFGTAAYVANTVIHLPSQLNPPNQPNPSILQYGSVLGDLVTSPAAVAAGIKSPYPNFVNNFGSSATVAQALAPYPQYAQIYNNFDDAGRTRYEGAQFSAEKRFTDGLAFLTSFTLSRTMGNVDSGFSTFAALPENKYNQAAEYTISGNDERWNTKVSGTYELPIGPGKKYFNTKGVVGQVAGGWQIGWITDYEQGTPFGISENGNPLGTAGGFNRPDRASGVASKTFGYGNAYIGQSPNPVANVFRTTAFVQTPNQYVLGDASRNYSSLRNPHYLNEDANVRKHFYFGEHVQGILQVDYFNLLNRTIFNGPDTNISDTTFGTITNVGQSNSNRQGQAQFRIEF